MNTEQQAELAKLISTDLFKKAREEVLRISESSVAGIPAPEATIQMAVEKGVRRAFNLLERITKPAPDQRQPTLKNTLKPEHHLKSR